MHMTTNHCPRQPARILLSVNGEKAIAEFAEKIMSQITEFAEENSMDEMTIIHEDILENWMDCPRCEVAVTDCAHKAYGMIIRRVMAFLESEF